MWSPALPKMWKHSPAESTFFICASVIVQRFWFHEISKLARTLLNFFVSVSYCYFLNNVLTDCLLWGVQGEKHQCHLLRDLATESVLLHAKEIHFPATPSEVNILFTVTEKMTYRHDRWSFRNSSTSWTIWQGQSLAFLSGSGGQHQHFERRFIDTECISAKLVIMLSASARDNVLTKGCCRQFCMNETNWIFFWQWGKEALPQPAVSLRAQKFFTKLEFISSQPWSPGKAL